MRTLYLHIGMPKTGTTAIQHFFAFNADALYSRGVYYPYLFNGGSRKHSNHYALSLSLLKKHSHLTVKEVRRAAPLVEIAGKLRDELAGLSENEDALISAESLSQHTHNQAALEDLASLLKPMAQSVKVIIYLRRQDIAFQSWWAEELKRFTDPKRCGSPDSLDALPVLRDGYDTLCDAWGQVFGKENLIVRAYERGQFPNGDVVDDFLSIFNLKKSDGFQIPPKGVNYSMPRDFIEFKRLMNTACDRCSSESRYFFPEICYAGMSAKGKGEAKLFSPAECLKMLERFDAGNERVAREYMGREDGILFHDKRPAPSDPWIPYPGLSEEACLSVFQALNTYVPYKAVWVTGLIARGLQSSDPEVRAASKKLSPILKCRRCSFLLWLPAQLPLKVLGLFKLPVLKPLLRWMLSRPSSPNSTEIQA